jgi:hypothetical protein
LLIFDSKIYTKIPEKEGREMAITAKLLQRITRPIRAGEVTLLPNPKKIALGRYENAFEGINLLTLSRKIIPEIPELGKFLHLAEDKRSGMQDLWLCAFLIELWQAYGQFKYEKRCDAIEPVFFYHLPKVMRTYLRFHFAMAQENRMRDYPRDIPFTGITYVFRRGSTASYLCKNEDDFQRLWELKQLANLSLPKWLRRSDYDNYEGVDDTRYIHSLDTGGLVNVATFNNLRFLPWIFRWAERLASYLHDIATVAGGDGMKPLDPEGLCEERNIDVVLRRKAWQEFFDEVGVPIQLVIDIVKNQDTYGLGTLLSYLDRNAFIARDLSILLRQYTPEALAKSEIAQFFLSHPSSLTLWDSIQIVPAGGKFLTVFTDPDRLFDFLKLRVLMFRDYYYMPEARSKRTIAAENVGKYLQSTGKLILPNLINMTDKALEQIIRDNLRIEENQDIPGDAVTETFFSLGESLQKEKSLLENSEADLTITEICKSKINPAIDEALVMDSKNRPVPFGDTKPGDADEIAGIATIKKPFFLHAIRKTGLNPNILARLKEFRIGEIERLLKQ